jgi:hypothetical protein
MINSGVFPTEIFEEVLEGVLEMGVGAFQQQGCLIGVEVLISEEDSLAVHN